MSSVDPVKNLHRVPSGNLPEGQQGSSVSIARKIEEVWKHGGPRTPDRDNELVDWVKAYFPGDYRTWTVIREAYRLRARERVA